LVSLIKQLDSVLSDNEGEKIYATVVLLDPAAKGTLAELAEKNGIKHVPLTVGVDAPKGPKAYSIGNDVPFTCVIYDNKKIVTASLAFAQVGAEERSQALGEFTKVAGVKLKKTEK
jgi:hypothetical protein